jgi:hypothetical protein
MHDRIRLVAIGELIHADLTAKADMPGPPKRCENEDARSCWKFCYGLREILEEIHRAVVS